LAHFDHSFLFSLEPFPFGFARVRLLDLVVRLVQGLEEAEAAHRLKLEEEVEGVVEEEASWNDDDLDVVFSRFFKVDLHSQEIE
jgi:hypothetical protein